VAMPPTRRRRAMRDKRSALCGSTGSEVSTPRRGTPDVQESATQSRQKAGGDVRAVDARPWRRGVRYGA
jgi:hypothetical protein